MVYLTADSGIRDIGAIRSPVLLFGGPYSNLQATRRLQEISEMRGIPPTQCICTGDVVAYCANPEETTQLIRDWNCHVVMGNCEQSVGLGEADCGCGFEAGSTCDILSVDWYNFTLSRISDESRRWMRSLPQRLFFTIGDHRFAVIHGGAANINQFVFESTETDIKRGQLDMLDVDCIVAGHCGIPFGQDLGGRYWLNAGAIGMPANDGRSSTWYMLMDYRGDGIQVSWHQLDYDYQLAANAMSTAGLHGAYRNTLVNGLWPSDSILPQSERKRQGAALNPPPIMLGSMRAGQSSSRTASLTAR